LPFKCNLQRYSEGKLTLEDKSNTKVLIKATPAEVGLCTLNQVDP
jgi:hypothetical protein